MSLTDGQKRVLDAIDTLHKEGKPVTNPNIAQESGIEVNTVKTHKTAIYKYYGIEGNDEEKMGKLLDILDHPPKEKVKSSFRVPVWMIAVFILAAGALSYLYFVPKSGVPQPTNTSRSTETKQPITATTEGQGATLPVVPIFTDTSVPTFTPIPPTFTPTFTMIPDTFTPSVSPTALTGVVFDADFSNGYPDSWKGMPNLPPIVNGVLETHEDFTFELGDETWKNYKVEMTFKTIPACSTELRLYLRAKSRDDAVETVMCDSYTHLTTVVGGNWSPLAEYSAPGKTFSIEANGDHLKIFGNDLNIANYPNGKIIFFITARWGIESIKVTLLP